MKLSRLYSESIAHFDKQIQEMLMMEHPHGKVEKGVPTSLSVFENNYVDWGFENLGISPTEMRNLYNAIIGTGIIIPNTDYKVRETPRATFSIEEIDGTETANMPENWKKAFYILTDKDEYVWIGRLVRQDQIGTFDRTTLQESEDGFGSLA